MGPSLENMANVITVYIRGVRIFVLAFYCGVVSHCYRASEPDMPIFLGAIAGFCDEDT